MPNVAAGGAVPDLWDSAVASELSEAQRLLYRSNLLGSDKRITNFGGGNTSAKISQPDPLTGHPVDVLWVKGSGGDLGTMKLDGFATLYMDKLESLRALYRGPQHEDDMVGYLPHCTFNLNPRAASIDTPLHAYVPVRHVDHTHPDAIIAIAAAEGSRDLTASIFGDSIGWLPWRRPGYELGLWLSDFCAQHPAARGVVLGSHGLFTWADSAEDCYRTTLKVINQAIAWFEQQTSTAAPAFDGPLLHPLKAEERRATVGQLMPIIRGLIGHERLKVGHFDDSPIVLEFVSSRQLTTLAALGTSCPDHFLRTKIRPLVIPFDPAQADLNSVIDSLPAALDAYRDDYRRYYERCRRVDSPPLRDPNAVVYLIPGIGMLTFAGDKAPARVSAEFYVNAINVMRGASMTSTYRGLDEQEAFDIEYWQLEEAKLQRLPPPRSLAGRVALITGGGGGIGRAIAERFLQEGACVMLADIDAERVKEVGSILAQRYSPDQVRTVVMDVTNEVSVAAAFVSIAVEFGGIDILVSNAGLANSASIEETSLALWNTSIAVLSTGYFLVSREAFRMMRKQSTGGAVVFIGSKNALAASPGAAAYCTAKASELHLARCLALEGATAGIRVNVVNPDAVLRGSSIWTGEWLHARAKAYGKDVSELEEHYRQRSLLKRSVFPEDIAEAAYFLAADVSSKSTGNIINVDAGNLQSFTR